MLADHRAAAQRGKADRLARRARRYGRRAPARCSRRASMPRPAAAASPSSSAVPDGASTLWRWCISRISMSKSRGSSALAACSTSTASRLTPRLILPDLTIVAWRAAAAILASSSGRAAGGADDVHDARLRGIAGELDGRGGHGEVEHAVGLGEGRQRIVGDRARRSRRRRRSRRHPCRDAASRPARRRRRRIRRPWCGWCGSASGPCGRRRRRRPGSCRSSLAPHGLPLLRRAAAIGATLVSSTDSPQPCLSACTPWKRA